MQERALLRFGSISAIVGAVLATVVNVAHPRVSDYSDAEPFLREIAMSTIWVSVHIGIVLAALLYLGGLAAIYRSITRQPGAGWARLGFAGGLVGVGTLLAWVGIDGFAIKWIAEAWVSAPESEKIVAFRVAAAAALVSNAMLTVWIIVLFGVAHVLYGLAVLWGEFYPMWLGWVAVLGGMGSIITGVLQAYTGPSALVLNILFPIFSLILTLWLLVMGFILWRNTAVASAP